MKNKAAAVKKGEEAISSAGVSPPGTPGKLEQRIVTVAGDVDTMSKDQDFDMMHTRLPEKGVMALYNKIEKKPDRLGIMDRSGTEDVAVLCIDATSPHNFDGNVSAFILEAPRMKETAAVVIVATNIDKMVKSVEDRHPVERYVDLFVLEAGLRPAGSSEIGLNEDAKRLHGYLKDLKPDQKEVLMDLTKQFVAGKLTRDDFRVAISEKVAEFNNKNTTLVDSAVSQGENNLRASKLRAMGQASPKLNRYNLEEVKSADVLSLMSNMANAKTIIDETKGYVSLKVNAEVSSRVKEMAQSVQRYVELSNKPIDGIRPAHEITLVLSAIDDPSRKPTAQNPNGSVGSAQKVAEANHDILSKFDFKNAGAADPMQVALDQVKPSASKSVEAHKQSAVTQKSSRSAQELDSPPIAKELSQGLLLDRLKKAFNISTSKIAAESAPAPSGVVKEAALTQSPKVSRGLPQWAIARPSHANSAVIAQDSTNSKGSAKSSQNANSVPSQSPVAPRAWAVNSTKAASAPDIRSSKADRPIAETSTPKMGK